MINFINVSTKNEVIKVYINLFLIKYNILDLLKIKPFSQYLFSRVNQIWWKKVWITEHFSRFSPTKTYHNQNYVLRDTMKSKAKIVNKYNNEYKFFIEKNIEVAIKFLAIYPINT